MTFAHYQQLQAAARKQIADKLAAIQPRGGNQVSVIGEGIAIEIPREEGEPATPTWELVIYARVRQIGFGSSPSTDWSEYSEAAGVFRLNNLFWKNSFWDSTQFFHSTDEEDPEFEPFGRDVEIELQVRTTSQGATTTTPFDEAIYRIPVSITVDTVIQSSGEVVDSRDFALYRDGATHTYTPPEDNIIYALNPTAIIHAP